MTQTTTDAANAAFWNEMCGSAAAQLIGVTGNDPESLARFDAWFFDFYPYLDRLIGFDDVNGKDVLEVGLGYGSVSQRLAQMGARFIGLDIAGGPVTGVNHRLAQTGLPGRAIQGSILDAPFEDASFDVVVAIGCYHHTGNLQQALDETRRLLRPGGRATIMVYNATSYLRWIRAPGRTWSYVRAVRGGTPQPLALDSEADRGDFDRDSAGVAAPTTELLSLTHFQRLLSARFADVRVRRVNAIAHRPLQFVPRALTLALVGPVLGLDLYARVRR